MAQADFVNNAFRALITGAGAKSSTSQVRAAHAEFVAALAGHPPRADPPQSLTDSTSRTAAIT